MTSGWHGAGERGTQGQLEEEEVLVGTASPKTWEGGSRLRSTEGGAGWHQGAESRSSGELEEGTQAVGAGLMG